MAGVVPSYEAALEMDVAMRSAAVIIAKEVEATRRFEIVQAIGNAIGGPK